MHQPRSRFDSSESNAATASFSTAPPSFSCNSRESSRAGPFRRNCRSLSRVASYCFKGPELWMEFGSDT